MRVLYPGQIEIWKKLLFAEGRNPDNLEKKEMPRARQEPTAISAIWRWSGIETGHIGRRQVFSPLSHPYCHPLGQCR